MLLSHATRSRARTTSRAAVAAAAAGVVLASNVLWAQGPRWTFTPRISVSQGYDDNVRLRNAGSEQISDQTTEDFVTGLRPSAELSFIGRRTTLDGSYDATFTRYYEVDRLNRFQNQGRFELNHRLSRSVTLFGRERFSVMPTTDDSLDEVVGGVPFRRVGSKVNQVGGGAAFDFGKRTSVTAAYTFQTVRFDRDLDENARLRGGTAHVVTTSFRQRVARRLSVGADYDVRHADLVDNTQAFDIQHIEGAVDFDLAENMSLSGGLGGAHLVTQGQTRSGPSYRLGWSYGGNRTNFDVRYRRSFVPSFGFGGTFDNQELRGTARFALSRRVSSHFGLSVRETDPLVVGEEPFQSFRLNAGLGYSMLRWASVEVYYAYSHQDARRAGGQVDRNRVGVLFSASKPMRIR